MRGLILSCKADGDGDHRNLCTDIKFDRFGLYLRRLPCFPQRQRDRCNVLILAVVIFMSQYVFQSTTTTLGAVLVLELFFDKVYVCIVVFCDLISSVTSHWILAVKYSHIGLLLPAVLTISDIRDAVALVDHVAGVLHHRRRAGIPESTIASLRRCTKRSTQEVQIWWAGAATTSMLMCCLAFSRM